MEPEPLSSRPMHASGLVIARARRPLALLLGLGLLLGACAGPAATGPTASEVAASPVPAGGYPGWPAGPDPDAAMVPIIVSTELVVGENRLLYALTDRSNTPIASPGLTTTIRVFDLAADPAAPVDEAPGTFIWTVPDEIGLYHATVGFERAGPWGVEITATPDGQPETTVRAVVDVREQSSTPAIGAPAPASDTPTATDAAGIAAISTDRSPDPAFYRTSVKDAVAAGRPFVLVFATPLYCSSRTCGPTLETVKAAVAPYGSAIEVIHVEPYRLRVTDGVPEPEFGADGRPQVVPAATEWGIPIEPYIFVVGADGKVATKLEGAIGADELRQAIDEVLAGG